MEGKMGIQKVIGISIICLVLAGTALAQSGTQGQAPGSTPKSNDSGFKYDYGLAFDAIDKNKDEKITKKEWLAAGMNQKSYDLIFTNKLDKNKDEVLSKLELGTIVLPEIDVYANKDGKITKKGLVKAVNKHVKKVANQGGDSVGASVGSTPAEQKK
jgi:hypothetical protein